MRAVPAGLSHLKWVAPSSPTVQAIHTAHGRPELDKIKILTLPIVSNTDRESCWRNDWWSLTLLPNLKDPFIRCLGWKKAIFICRLLQAWFRDYNERIRSRTCEIKKCVWYFLKNVYFMDKVKTLKEDHWKKVWENSLYFFQPSLKHLPCSKSW